jgi:predicted DNA-binding transcriptional regulator AlpA
MTAATTAAQAAIAPDALLRKRQILGDARRGVPAIVNVSSSTWERGVRDGRFPAPIKLGPKLVVWRARDVFAIGDNQQRAA